MRGLRYHVRTWGEPGARKLVLLHGWMDVSASFQFLVDALASDWQVLAPDWRGFGLSEWPHDGYWFADYVADLDGLVRVLAPDGPVDIAGHSLGGNVALLYAGLRPARVRKVVSLDGFGIPGEGPEAAPKKFAAWLDALEDSPALAPYRDLAAVADRLQKNNRRLPREHGGVPGLALGRDAGRWHRAAACRSAPQASVPERVPAGGSLRDLAADRRARAVGRGGRFQHPALARRRWRSGGRDRAHGWPTFPARAW